VAVTELQIDFENRLASKCEFRPATAEQVAKYKQRAPERAGERSDEQLAIDLGKIFPVGEIREVRASSKAMQDAVKLLVERERSSKPFREMVIRLMQTVGIQGSPEYGEDIQSWQHVSDLLRQIAQGKAWHREMLPRGWGPLQEVRWPHPAAQEVGQLGIFLVPNGDGKPVLAVRPTGLQDALVLYAARMKASGTTFQQCEHCHIPFLSGGPEGRGGGRRRGDARFCSDDCRYGYHNELRRKTARKRKL
jgi:hypothetical protein